MGISQKTEQLILRIQKLQEERVYLTEKILILQQELTDSYENDKLMATELSTE